MDLNCKAATLQSYPHQKNADKENRTQHRISDAPQEH